MSNQTTLLVLGSGASRPYHFPTAIELRKLIIGETNLVVSHPLYHINDGNIRGRCNPTNIRGAVESITGVKHEDVRRFLSEFAQSRIDSVDAFCFLNKERHPEYAVIASCYIAVILLICEHLGAQSIHGDWYDRIWNDIIRPELDTANPRLEVVSFNYDRSLEYFLDTVFAAVGRPEQVKERIHIHHVYGDLGALREVGFGEIDLASKAFKNVRLMQPRLHSDKPWLEEADRANKIIFLGFGFDSLNVSTLGIESNLSKTVIYWASCYHLSESVKYHASSALGRIEWGDYEQKIEDFLNKRYIHL